MAPSTPDALEEAADARLAKIKPSEEERDKLAELVKIRKAVRARFTRKAGELEASLAQQDQEIELGGGWDLLASIHAEISALNKEITPLLVRCAPEKLEDALERAEAYDERFTILVGKLRAQARKSVQPQEQSPPTVQAVPQLFMPGRQYKLPKFSGDRKKFREWWQLFTVHVHKKQLDPIEKFTFLKDSLTGIPALEIAHLEFSASQYEEAVKIIEEKFGSAREAEKEHLLELRNLCKAKDLHISDRFVRFVSSLSQNVKALISLGTSIDTISLIVSQDVLRCLPRSMSEDFTRKHLDSSIAPNEPNKSELKLLLEYLEKEVVVKRTCAPQASFPSTSRVSRDDSDASRQSKFKSGSWSSKPSGSNDTSSSFLTKNEEVDHSCVFCASTKHESKACKKSLSYEERRELCDKNNACYRCLKRHHIAKRCRAKNVKCEGCGKRHFAVMCNAENLETTKTGVHSTQIEPYQPNPSSRRTVCFQTGLVWVNGPLGRKVLRFFLDSGSERSYVSEFAIGSLGLRPVSEERLAMITIGGKVSGFKMHKVYELGLQSRFDDRLAITVAATGLPEIAKGSFPQSPETFNLMPLADQAETDVRREIDILIGLDVLPQIMCGEEKVFENRMVANKTIFGWVIAGSDRSQSNGAQAQVFVTANLYQPGTKLRGSQVISMATISAVRDDSRPTVRGSGAESGWEQSGDGSETTSTVIAERSADLKRDLEMLWSTEMMGLEDPQAQTESSIETELQRFFKNNLSRLEDGRYMVSLPFKENLRTLGDNENVAMGSLKRFLFKARKSKDLLQAVDREMKQFIEKGYAEPATPKKAGELVHYLPILPVVRRDADKQLIKVRVVKDAGARRKDEAALNDVVEEGVNLLPDLFKVLLRFRRDEIAIVSDIERAFSQYRVHPDHRTFLRFFWPTGISEDQNAPVREYWSTSLDFGISASPFIHCAGVRYHLRFLAQKHPEHATLLRDIEEHFYMDDLVYTTDNTSRGLESFDFLFGQFNAAGFRLRKWATNSSQLGEQMRASLDDPEIQISYGDTESKFLGISWNLGTDELSISMSAAIETLETNAPSKRTLLKSTAAIFDPLGFISPLTIKPKTLLQSLWKQKLDWDTVLDGENLKAYKEITDALKSGQHFRLLRNINTNTGDVVGRHLHLFCDASSSALGCCAFIREIQKKGGGRVYLVASKARVVPLKAGQSIHKLELLGAVMAARMGDMIKRYLNYHFESTKFWCDNSPTLHWIKSSPERWKIMVANRIKIIQSLTSPADWDYVASADNPADLLSRGLNIMSDEFRSMWTSGPQWLAERGEPYTKHRLNELFDREMEAERKSVAMITVEADAQNEALTDGSRLSSWITLVNSMARMIRWPARRHLSGPQKGMALPVTADEFVEATCRILRIVQRTHFGQEVESQCTELTKDSKLFKLAPFVDAQGLIRVRSRLERDEELSYEEKYPIALPGAAHIVRLLAKFYHEKRCFHVGGVAGTLSILRKRFYILSARRAVRSVLAACKICMRFRVEAASEPVPPLPNFRLATAPPYTVCATDHAGPIAMRHRSGEISKGYFLIFVCAATRAIHLELVPDLSAYEFLLALRRFLSRYTATTKILSDNGKAFIKGARELRILYDHVKAPQVQGHLASAEISWEFITARAPWQGGWWERLVGCVRRPLRRVLQRGPTPVNELATILAEIAAWVNLRPLTSVQVDANEVSALCPADLLYGHRAKPGLPEIGLRPGSREAASAIVFSQRWKHQQSILRAFRRRFKDEYHGYLRSAHIRPEAASRPLEVGDVCLLKDDDPSRAQWPLCRILSLSGGERTDLRKRSCLIKLATGQVYKRPIQLLYPLEV